jgi:glycosyltransferase involved in cell wall biosynthesis
LLSARSVKVEVHILAYNEAEILPFTLRNYNTLAERIVVHDGGSMDETRNIARRWGAEVHHWDTSGQLNDQLAKELKNTCWHGTDADWVIVVDADEIVFFPLGVEETLRRYTHMGLPVVKLTGWEMFSFHYPKGSKQIYDEVKQGARDDYWYGKPVLFRPAAVADIQYHAGAHGCRYRSQDGVWHEGPGQRTTPTDPPTWLLHCKHLGPVERIAERYDATRARLAEVNVANRWGNFDPGMKHAMDKRAAIMPKLEKLFP